VKRTARILVLLLLLANAGLIYYAVKHHSNKPPPGGPVVVPTTPATGAAASPLLVQDAATAPATVKDPAPLFSAASTVVSWRATGGCTAPANLQISRDSGVVWSNAVQPAFHILAINATSGRSGSAIGADVYCRPTRYVTNDGGRTWSPRSLKGVWIGFPNGVYGPAGKITKPCHGKVLELGSAGNDGLVQCSVGVFRSDDGGRTWTAAGKLTAGTVESLALTTGGHAVVFMAGSPGCNGMRSLVSDDAGASWQVTGCLTATQSPTFVALAANGDGQTTSFSAVYRTTDYGRTWD
jgi:photosystem II stability/assembly factor-like uncharacterized protein